MSHLADLMAHVKIEDGRRADVDSDNRKRQEFIAREEEIKVSPPCLPYQRHSRPLTLYSTCVVTDTRNGTERPPTPSLRPANRAFTIPRRA